jgi:hypothetical protein
MAENRVVNKYGKKPLLYALVMTILTGIIGLLGWININQADSYYYFAQSLVFVVGIVHTWLMYKFLPVTPGDFWKGLLLTVLIMCAGALAVAIVYYFIHLDYRFLTYIFAFIVPFLCWQVYQGFFQIPAAVYKAWYYPLDQEMPDLDMIDLSQIEVVQFVFSKKLQDATQTSFTSKAPLNMTLGQLFFIFINDYNDKNVQHHIEYLKSAQDPFGWLFYRKTKWFNKKHFFDAELSFRDNSIQPNELIYAERVN